MNNINDTYFDSHYKDIWRAIIPAELTVKEVEFMLSYFKLEPGNKVLDLMCGYGRHAIALAQKGIAITAVDNLDEYIREITETAKKESLLLEAVKQDAVNFKSSEQYDLALCMGNSLNFFNAADVHTLLSNIHSALKPGGHLLINSWSLTEIAVKSFVAKTWSEINGLRLLTSCEFLFQPTRMEFTTTAITPDGKTEEKKGIDYVYSVAETDAMLQQAGFSMKEIYSIPGRKKFTLGEPRAYIVAMKND